MIGYTLDTAIARTALSTAARDQIPFAVSLALNDVTRQAQDEVRRQVDARFTVAPERRTFMHRLVKFGREDRATKSNLEARLSIIGPNRDPTRGTLLARHEDGGSTQSADPLRPVYIPADFLRPTDRSLPPRKLYPSALGMTPYRQVDGSEIVRGARLTKAGKMVLRGKHQTWVVPLSEGRRGLTPGIYQRTGKARDDIQLLWLYVPRITVTRRLAFDQTVTQVSRERIGEAFERGFARAMGTAR